jgi:putative ABC transport system ATP-binding protein
MMNSAVEGRLVCKYYRGGVRALDNVSVSIPTCAFACLAGRSGSGKTTLLGLFGVLDRPTSGSILISGQDVSHFSDTALARMRRRIGFVSQDFALIPGLPAWENVEYPLIPRGIGRLERRRLAAQVLDRLGLSGRATAKPRTLSGGEQQRVAIARALAVRPELLLADEPTSNLDEESAQLVIALLAEIHAAGTTVVVASHDPRVIAHANRVVELSAGRLLAAPTE